jgi:hypothetical protein
MVRHVLKHGGLVETSKYIEAVLMISNNAMNR